ncbi:MAG TPA: RNA polymerase sigma-54 factor, partial [Candidatus Binatia bacterium]
MALEIRQVQRLAQQLVMTPQLQQAIKLLQLSRIELEEMVSQELMENPTLEESQPGEPDLQPLKPEEDLPDRIEPPEPARELSAADRIGTMDWQDYLDTHSNSLHGSLTAEAGGEDEEGPPSWENTLTKKTSFED